MTYTPLLKYSAQVIKKGFDDGKRYEIDETTKVAKLPGAYSWGANGPTEGKIIIRNETGLTAVESGTRYKCYEGDRTDRYVVAEIDISRMLKLERIQYGIAPGYDGFWGKVADVIYDFLEWRIAVASNKATRQINDAIATYEGAN